MQRSFLFIALGLYFSLINESFGQNNVDTNCNKSNPEKCYLLGQEILKDSKPSIQALPYFEKGCEFKNTQSCIQSGFIKRYYKDDKAALSYFEKACQLKSLLGCHFEAISREALGENNLATDKFKINCESNYVDSCWSYAFRINEKGNIRQAQEIFVNNCKLRHMDSCLFAGLNLYTKMNKVPESIPFFEKSCEMDMALSCSYLGLTLRTVGRNLDSVKATKKACDLSKSTENSNTYCSTYGSFELELGEESKGEQILSDLCNKNIDKHCASLGNHYFKKSSFEKAHTYLEKACQLGVSDSCIKQGLALIEMKKINEARLHLSELCLKKIPQSCSELYENKQLASEKVNQVISQACSLGSNEACKIFESHKFWKTVAEYFNFYSASFLMVIISVIVFASKNPILKKQLKVFVPVICVMGVVSYGYFFNLIEMEKRKLSRREMFYSNIKTRVLAGKISDRSQEYDEKRINECFLGAVQSSRNLEKYFEIITSQIYGSKEYCENIFKSGIFNEYFFKNNLLYSNEWEELEKMISHDIILYCQDGFADTQNMVSARKSRFLNEALDIRLFDHDEPMRQKLINDIANKKLSRRDLVSMQDIGQIRF